MSKKREIELLIKANDQAKGTLNQHKSQLDGLKASHVAIGVAAVAAAAAVVKGALDSVRAVVRQVQAMADLGAEMDKMSFRTGVSVEALTEWEYAVQLGGGSAQDFEAAARRLGRSIYDANRGVKESAEAFEALGVDVVDAHGNLRSVNDVMYDIADGMQAAGSDTERMGLAMIVLGRGGTKLLPAMMDGAAGVREMRDELRELGGVMSTEYAKKSAEFIDSQLRMDKAIAGLKRSAAEPIFDPLATMLNNTARMLSALTGNISDTREELSLLLRDADAMAAASAQFSISLGLGQDAPSPEQMRKDFYDQYGYPLPDVDSAPNTGGIPGPVPWGDVDTRARRLMMEMARERAGYDLSPEMTAGVDEGIGILGDGFGELDEDVLTVVERLKSMEETGVTAAQQIGAQFTDAFAMMIAQGESLEDIFGNLLQMALQLALSIGLRSAFGLPLPFAQGGDVPMAAAGMGVPGQDSIMGMFGPGESVLDRELSQELRAFVRQGRAAATVAPMRPFGRGGSSVTLQIARPMNRRDFVALGRDTRRAMADQDKAVF